MCAFLYWQILIIYYCCTTWFSFCKYFIHEFVSLHICVCLYMCIQKVLGIVLMMVLVLWKFLIFFLLPLVLFAFRKINVHYLHKKK